MSEYSPTRSEELYLQDNFETKYASMVEQRFVKDREINTLKEQLQRLSVELRDEVEAHELDIQGKDRQIKELTTDLKTATRQQRELTKTLDDISNDKEKLKRNYQKLIKDNESLEDQKSKFKNQRKMLFDKVEEINRSVMETSERLRSKDKLLQDSQSERRTLEKVAGELKLELDQLNDQLEMRQAKIKDLEECVHEHLQNHLDNANSHGTLISQVSELQSLKASHMQRISELQEQNQQLRERVGQYQQQLKYRDSDTRVEIADLENKMVDIKNIIDVIGDVTERIKTVRQTKIKVQRDMKSSLLHLQRLTTSFNES